jgi:hypothetical protein
VRVRAVDIANPHAVGIAVEHRIDQLGSVRREGRVPFFGFAVTKQGDGVAAVSTSDGNSIGIRQEGELRPVGRHRQAESPEHPVDDLVGI